MLVTNTKCGICPGESGGVGRENSVEIWLSYLWSTPFQNIPPQCHQVSIWAREALFSHSALSKD